MTGNDYINFAKKAFYPTETFVDNATLAMFINEARKRVAKLAKVGYKEDTLTLQAHTANYTLSTNILKLFRVLIQWDNTIRYELMPIPYGHFPLSTSTFFAPPWNYAFIPSNKLQFYPCPDREYTAFLYFVPFLSFKYSDANLSQNDPDITNENYFEAVSAFVASHLARNDQNYELSELFENIAIRSLSILKT